MPLGLMPEDCVLFYTDGLVEAHGEDCEMFGLPRLKQRMREYSGDGGLIEFLYNDLQSFTGPE